MLLPVKRYMIKIMERSLGTQMSYEEFAVFDLQNKSQTRSAKPTVGPSKPFTLSSLCK